MIRKHRSYLVKPPSFLSSACCSLCSCHRCMLRTTSQNSLASFSSSISSSSTRSERSNDKMSSTFDVSQFCNDDVVVTSSVTVVDSTSTSSPFSLRPTTSGFVSASMPPTEAGNELNKTPIKIPGKKKHYN